MPQVEVGMAFINQKVNPENVNEIRRKCDETCSRTRCKSH